MANYNYKKKLIEDNPDIYISEFDKALHPNALSGIIESKKSYKEAQKNNDFIGMNRANQKANTIRERFGNYHGGDDGSEYNRNAQDFEERDNTGYNSLYKTKIKDLTEKIADFKSFDYDPESDPVYLAYKSVYTKLGDDAFDRALAQNSLRSGGVASSTAISAATAAKNRYNSMLSGKIPELYESNYKKYSDAYNRLYKELETLSKLDKEMYSRYRDEMSDFENDRKYFGDKETKTMENLNDIYKIETDYDYNIQKNLDDIEYKKQKDNKEYEYRSQKDNKEFEYKKQRDEITDKQWLSEYNQKQANIAVNLAKALYGKVPISSSVIKNLLTLIQ